jgi:hypothetical protein
MRNAIYLLQDLIDIPLRWLNERFFWLTKAFYVSIGLEDLVDETEKAWEQAKENIRRKKCERRK